MAELKVEDQKLQGLIELAILQALDATAQHEMLKSMVRYLTTTDGFRDKSPLQHALNDAAANAARKYFTTKVETDPVFVAEIEKLYADAAKRCFDTDQREKMVQKMADSMTKALGDRY